MAVKKKSKTTSHITKTIFNLVILFPTIISLVGKVLTLLGYEARLAGRNLARIVVLIFCSAIVLASTWLCILAMIFFYLISIGLNNQLALLVLVLSNVVILLIFGIMMNKSQKKLLFRATRRQIRNAMKRHDD